MLTETPPILAELHFLAPLTLTLPDNFFTTADDYFLTYEVPPRPNFICIYSQFDTDLISLPFACFNRQLRTLGNWLFFRAPIILFVWRIRFDTVVLSIVYKLPYCYSLLPTSWLYIPPKEPNDNFQYSIKKLCDTISQYNGEKKLQNFFSLHTSWPYKQNVETEGLQCPPGKAYTCKDYDNVYYPDPINRKRGHWKIVHILPLPDLKIWVNNTTNSALVVC